MALIPSFMRRPSAILRMPDALKRGLSASGFIRELKGMGLSYRKTLMLSDWRTVHSIEAKKDLVQFVRRDRLPTGKVMAEVTWEYSREYVYKLNTWSRLRPDDDLTERTVTMLSDRALTPREVEQQVAEKWPSYEKYQKERLERVKVSGVFRIIPGPEEEQ